MRSDGPRRCRKWSRRDGQRHVGPAAALDVGRIDGRSRLLDTGQARIDQVEIAIGPDIPVAEAAVVAMSMGRQRLAFGSQPQVFPRFVVTSVSPQLATARIVL